MRRRVVVSGLGVINPLGNDVETMWKALQESRSGVGPITVFDVSGYPTTIAAEVKNWDVSKAGESPEDWLHCGRHTKFAVGAAKQAIAQSGIFDSKIDPTRIGVYLGAGEGNQNFKNFTEMVAAAVGEPSFNMANFLRCGFELMNPREEMEQEPNMPAAHLAALFDAQGPNSNCLTACAASSQAVGEATELIRAGDADAMIAGGCHSMIHPFGLTGFSLLTTGAPIFGEVLGYGSTADAYRITDIHPEGRGAIGCMKQAIADAKLSLEEIGYVNAHGTSTTVNDRTETLACKGVFGERAKITPVSSTKSMMGHLIAAAGATEMIVCLLAIRDGILPPTINQENPDPDCDLDYIPNVARQSKIRVALNNSFGFGGQNVTLAVGSLRNSG